MQDYSRFPPAPPARWAIPGPVGISPLVADPRRIVQPPDQQGKGERHHQGDAAQAGYGAEVDHVFCLLLSIVIIPSPSGPSAILPMS